jgi:hypothetical protein
MSKEITLAIPGQSHFKYSSHIFPLKMHMQLGGLKKQP